MSLQFSDVMLGSIELFCLAAEHESFTEAANRAGLTPAAVSRNVLRLEQRLGVRLFVRSTRKIRLSEAGRSYYLQCKQALAQIVEAEREAGGQQVVPAGNVKISMPTPFGHHCALPLMPAFHEKYPQIKLDLQLSNWNVNFMADGFDLAVRVRVPPDSGMVARKLLDAELVVVAAPAYLHKHGTPMTLEDLDQHNCIQFVLPSIGQNVTWQFRRD
ncbi:MAG: LysR family transcriptional regulator, partial [Undibacterium sp.]|nr:LysR family transcriptional regulator [Undibacterium sp.]